MKRLAVLALAGILVIQMAVAAVAIEPEDARGLLDEAVPCTSQSDGLWALLSRKWQDQNSATLFASGPGLIYSSLGHTMPTTGDVRPLVLPIDFPDMKMTESEHERLVRNLYAENDLEKGTSMSSAKAQLYRLSYGKLNLVGDPDKDILPIYTAPENRDYYIKENSSKLKSNTYKWIPLINTALASYFDDDPERDYADYDADGDGCIDALIIWSATHTNAFFITNCGPEGAYKINDPNIKYFNKIEIGPWMMDAGSIAHELGHAMGLDEAYEPRWCEIPHVLTDLMGCTSVLHLNVFSRYILNWVDPLVITASDPVQSIDLYSADWYGGEFDDSKPRAIVLIPENKDLPLTEFYMVEYRPNEATRLGDVNETYPILGEGFPNQPGVLIWHCDTEWDFDYYQFFVHQDRYRLPVYRNGDTSSFSYEDFYTTGTVFSPETTPNSAFYDGTETGIYVEVVQADGGEYAKLKVGFLDILPPEAGDEGMITASDVTTDTAVLSWTAAQDKQTGTDDLIYTLYRSDSDELDTVEQCEAAAPVAAGAGLTTSTVNSLEAGNTYYFNVVVEDQAGNKATYEKVTVTTHTHDYGKAWQYDPAGHWHECACGDRADYAAHSGGTATCAQKAVCEFCGQPYGEVDADNHRYDYTQAPAWNWTGTTAATATWICDNDAGHTDVHDAEISSAVTTAQSCTDDEMTVYTASVMVGGKTYTDSLLPVKTREKLGHDWSEASCTEPKTCSRCSATEGDTLGHDWQAATCTAPKTCSRCHTTEGEALGHDFAKSWSKDAENHWHVCSRCDAVSGDAEHTEDAGTVTKAPTEEEAGEKVYHCSVCGHVMRTEELPALNHVHDFSANGICACGAYEPAEPDGDGVFQIANAGNLYWFAQEVNGGQSTISGKLVQSVRVNTDVLNSDGTPKGNAFQSWAPIGTRDDPFSGTFDGDGKTISGLYYDNTGGVYAGLFGYTKEALIENVAVADSYFRARHMLGGVCGANVRGTVRNCQSAASVRAAGADNADVGMTGGVCGVNSGTIEGCVNTGVVDSANILVGGVCGSNNFGGIVTSCRNAGSVTGAGRGVGGVVGGNSGGSEDRCAVISCVNTGAVSGSKAVGGVVGANARSTVRDCYNTGTVRGEDQMGGVCGANSADNESAVSNCYYLEGSADGGINGADVQAEAEAKSLDEFRSGAVAWLLQEGDAIWGQTIGSDDYPVLNGAQVYRDYTGTDCIAKGYTNVPGSQPGEHAWSAQWSMDRKYHWHACSRCGEISDRAAHSEDTGTVTKAPTEEETGEKVYVCSVCGYVMRTEELPMLNHVHDFSANGICACGVYEPTEPDGDGVFQITNAGNLYWFAQEVNSGSGSIHGKLMNDITVNTHVLDQTGEPESGPFRAWTPIGTIASRFIGVFDGDGKTISGLYCNNLDLHSVGLFGNMGTGAVIQNTAVADSFFRGSENTGSMCGTNAGGTIRNCHNSATVSGAYVYAGGVCGHFQSNGVMEYCSNIGVVKADSDFAGGLCGYLQSGTVRSCYNLGPVTVERAAAGGVCGANSTGTVEHCYSIGSVAGELDVGGVCGINTIRGTVSNCYYPTGNLSGIGGQGDAQAADQTGTTAKTPDEFKSGAVAWFLQEGDQAWGQTIGSDDYPVLGGLPVYYGYTGDDCITRFYTNDANAPIGQPGEHVWDQGAVTTPAGCENVGGKTYTCTVCGQTRTEEIAALGHDWSESTCAEPKTCSRCRATEGEPLGHDWGEWMITQPATVTTEGRKERICARCSEIETQGIPPLGFDFSVVAWQFRDANGAACAVPVDGGTLAAITIERAEGAPDALVIVAVYSGDAMTGVKILSPIGEEDPVGLLMDHDDTAKVFVLHPRALIPFEVAGSTVWPW